MKITRQHLKAESLHKVEYFRWYVSANPDCPWNNDTLFLPLPNGYVYVSEEGTGFTEWTDSEWYIYVVPFTGTVDMKFENGNVVK